jgi:uncharacterized protein DUF5670
VLQLGLGLLFTLAEDEEKRRTGVWTLANILWAVLVILVALWLIGFIGGIGSGFIHLLLVVAVIILIYNLLVGRSTV